MTPTNTCLDAETLAAWADGGLDPAAAAMAEAHVSSCDRCQAILGLMAKTEPVLVPAEAPWFRRFRAGWLIPLTAGVAAVGLWMIVPANRSTTVPPTQPAAADEARTQPANEAQTQATNEVQNQAPAATTQAPAESSRMADAKRQKQEPAAVDQLAKNVESPTAGAKEEKAADRARADLFEARDEPARPMAAPPAPAAPAAGASAAPAQALGRVNAKALSSEIASPNPRTRWRLRGGGNVEYTPDGGQTWEATPTGVTEQLTAGSSPTADVCWMVGKDGVVLLTTDGRHWQRLAFPETIDLAAVLASDSRSALVTAADGMLFRTNDGGASWNRP
ncbi:MAG: YCF48-related protein [Vicinamibacterales bacterium]